MQPKIIYVVTEDWYFCSHRLPVARAARDLGFDVIVATGVTEHAEAIRGEGFRLVELPWRRRGTVLRDELRTLFRLMTLYRQERPDVVHHVSMKPVLVGSIAARMVQLPTVVNAFTGLGYIFTSQTRSARTLRMAMLLAFRGLSAGRRWCVLVQNSDDGLVLESAGAADPDRLVLIRGSGVDTQRFVPAPFPPGRVGAVLVARMIRQKGIEEFVRAAELLRKRDCDVHMVLAGDADEGNPDAIRVQDLQRWAEEGLVEWRGKVEDIPDLWSMSHIAVLPSRGGEGVPKSLIEAASCGRPIVATDVPGCRDIVRDGQNGVLVPVGDAEKLADAIEALANDRESQHRMGHRGRELVLEHYSADVIAARTGELYRELTPALPASER